MNDDVLAVVVKCPPDCSVRINGLHIASGDETTMNALAYGINAAYAERVRRVLEEAATFAETMTKPWMASQIRAMKGRFR